MTGEFTNICNRYYELKQLHARSGEHLNQLLENAPLYSGEMCISNIDAIISYYRNAQAEKAEVDKLYKQILATERDILLIMRHFEIPPNTVLYGEIPFDLEYEISADENDQLTITKINSLQPEEDDPNVILIKLWQDGEENEY